MDWWESKSLRKDPRTPPLRRDDLEEAEDFAAICFVHRPMLLPMSRISSWRACRGKETSILHSPLLFPLCRASIFTFLLLFPLSSTNSACSTHHVTRVEVWRISFVSCAMTCRLTKVEEWNSVGSQMCGRGELYVTTVNDGQRRRRRMLVAFCVVCERDPSTMIGRGVG